MVRPVRVALVGYGVGGRCFHAPFIEAAPGIEVAVVVTRSEQRRAQVADDIPGVPVADDLTAASMHGVDVAVVTTPPETRRGLVLEALGLGLAVVADKPFAPDAATARELRDAAAAAGLPLAVFHNRRWDSDIRTLRAVLDQDLLGRIERFTSRMDQDSSATLEATEGGGLLRDLGSHLVDQALWLFGPAETVYGELDHRELPEGRVDTGFLVSIEHASGVKSLLTASKVNRAVQRELRLLGEGGSYRSDGTDVQADAVLAGIRPVWDLEHWGYERPDRLGVLSRANGTTTIPSAQGAYQDYYRDLAAAVRGEGAVPVSADDAVRVLEVLDAARRSAVDKTVVPLPSI